MMKKINKNNLRKSSRSGSLWLQIRQFAENRLERGRRRRRRCVAVVDDRQIHRLVERRRRYWRQRVVVHAAATDVD